MWKYKDEVYLKPSNFERKSYILGIENGFLLILLLRSRKSEMKGAVEIINVGAAN